MCTQEGLATKMCPLVVSAFFAFSFPFFGMVEINVHDGRECSKKCNNSSKQQLFASSQAASDGF